jgi:hypothetical protein
MPDGQADCATSAIGLGPVDVEKMGVAGSCVIRTFVRILKMLVILFLSMKNSGCRSLPSNDFPKLVSNSLDQGESRKTLEKRMRQVQDVCEAPGLLQRSRAGELNA